jgi:hypothetical protein
MIGNAAAMLATARHTVERLVGRCFMPWGVDDSPARLKPFGGIFRRMG